MPVFVEISALLLITVAVTAIVRLLKQPLVVGYILSGIVVGPYMLNLLNATHELELFSKVGIVMLLFIVGLHLNPTIIKELGKVSLITGLGQVMFTSVAGFILTLILGLDRLASLYVAIALTFSSTIIILKLLSDKKDLQKLYAKIAIGFLLVQDVVATIILILVALFAKQDGGNLAMTLGFTLVKGVGLLVGLILCSSVVLPRLTKSFAKSQELLFLFSMAWSTGLASLFLLAGFSLEIGALIAGVSLSTTAYAEEMSSRMKPLRDFFIVIFFILLGSQMVLSDLSKIILPAIVLSSYVLIGNPIIMIVLMNLLGFSRRTGFMAGLTVAQISEFSLILAALGLQVGHISQQTLSMVTLVGLITISGSTYMILYAEKLYPKLAQWIKFLELVKRKPTEASLSEHEYKYVLFGYDRVGQDFVEIFEQLKEQYVVVDFNPKSIERMAAQKTPYAYGDASDVEFLEELPFNKVKLVISTIPEHETNLIISKHIKQYHKSVILVLIAHTTKEAKELYKAGASYVIMPHHLGAQYAAKMIQRLGLSSTRFNQEKQRHLKELREKYSFV